MRKTLPFTILCLWAVTASAAEKIDFSGTWVFTPSKSKNVGMMAALQLTSTIKQTATMLTITNVSKMNGQEDTREVRYDLTGKPAPNVAAMGDKSETVTKWVGGKLVTTWTSEGAIAGTKVVRTETRSLSPDGKTMTVETVRGSNPSVVMVFEKK